VAERDGEVRSLGMIPNRPESIRKVIRKLGGVEELQVCYEAGPCGYVVYWQMVQLGVRCDVVAPTLVPVKAGDRVKTDRRDAERLARSLRAGDLTAVWVPDQEHEALRDLVRAREAAKKDQLRARHRLQKFLLRHGRRAPMKAWSSAYFRWLDTVTFEQPGQRTTMFDYTSEVHHGRERVERLDRALDEAVASAPAQMRAVIEALQCLRGVAKLTAITAAVEVGRFSRFTKARQLMGYSGAVASEYSSGGKTQRGGITKTGNAHLRRVVVEAAWAYRFKPALYPALRKRTSQQSETVKGIAWKAQLRLCARYRKLVGKGKEKQKVVTALGRELLGFMWAIGVQVESQHEQLQKAA
jgi:transposase